MPVAQEIVKRVRHDTPSTVISPGRSPGQGDRGNCVFKRRWNRTPGVHGPFGDGPERPMQSEGGASPSVDVSIRRHLQEGQAQMAGTDYESYIIYIIRNINQTKPRLRATALAWPPITPTVLIITHLQNFLVKCFDPGPTNRRCGRQRQSFLAAQWARSVLSIRGHLAFHVRHVFCAEHQASRRNANVALVPPNPKLFDNTVSHWASRLARRIGKPLARASSSSILAEPARKPDCIINRQ